MIPPLHCLELHMLKTPLLLINVAFTACSIIAALTVSAKTLNHYTGSNL